MPLAANEQIAECLAEHPPSHYDPKQPWERSLFDFRAEGLIWAKSGDVWKEGVIQYVEGATVAVRLDGEDKDRRYKFDSGRIWLRFATREPLGN